MTTAVTQTTNIVPVQGVFAPEPTFALQYFVGPAGTPFLPPSDPNIDGATITNSTINSTPIGAIVPAAGYFTSIAALTGTVATSPSADTDIANKAYVDSVAQGLDIKASCLYGTTNNITLSGLATQAGGDWASSLTAGDRILVKSQTNQAENGIYLASASGWTRSSDMNTWAEVPGSFTFIEEGATLMSTGWVTTAGHTGTIGVTAMPWTQFSGAGTYVAGNGLQLVGNAFSVKANGTSLDVSSSGVQISPTWPGQTSITTLGTIATGTWHGSTIAVAYGGTGATDAPTARTNLGAAASGANSDITSLSGITGGVSTPDYIDFHTTAGVTAAVGRIWWDGGTTLNVGMTTNVTGVVNESLFIYIKASVAITKGDVVVQDGAVGASGVLKAKPAPTGTTNAQTILGIAAESIGINVFGLIQTHGYLKGLNTTGSAVGETWADGDELYYNPAYTGGLTKVKPTAPNLKLPMAEVVNAGSGSSGSLFINIGASSVLGGTDSNVQFGTLNNLDVIQYDSIDGYWKNVAASTLSVSYAATAGSAGSATTATTATNLAAGAAGSLPYQTGSGATSFLGIGTSTYILTSSGTAPQWTNPSGITVGSATSATSATTATNLAGGAAASIPYQSAAGTTAFLASAAGDANKVLQSNGTSAPSWVTPTAYATVTDDTSTNATRYPLFASATTGNLATEYVSSTKLQYVPSTGILTATGFSGSGSGLTSLPAGQLSGTIPSAVLGNSTVYIGTTAIVLNRSSASQSLTGVSIDGSAGSATTATTATNATNVGVTDNTTTNSDYYVTYVTNTIGNLPITVASTKFRFNPSTGVLTSTSFSGAGTDLTGTASALSIGGNAANVTGIVAVANGGTGASNAATARTNLGATTVGGNFFTLTNPSAITFPRINADNTVSALTASAFRTAIGAGTGSGTVTSVSWTGGIVSIATSTTTPAFTIAGTSGGIPYFSSGTTWATSAALAANAIVLGGGAGSAPATTTTGTGVVTAIGNAVNTTGGFVTQSGTLAASALLLGGGSGTAISSTTTGTGVVTALGNAINGTGGFVTADGTATLTNKTLSAEVFSTSATVTAGTNAQGQGAITSDYNVVTTTTANPSGVTLPTATTGRRVIIVNKGTNPVNVYPATGGAIDALAANASISLPVGSVMEFNASSTTQWYSSYNLSIGSAASSTTATNLAAGTAGAVPYQTGAGATSFLSLGTTNYVLTAGASAPQYVAQSTLAVGSATNATNTVITDDTSTAADMYLTWVTANTGNLPQKVTSTKLKFNPSTGVLTATGGTGGGNF